MAENQEKYSKTFGHFTVQDWNIFARSKQIKTAELQKCATKSDLIKLILTSKPNYQHGLDEKYFFESFIDPNGTKRYRAKDSTENPDDYPEKKNLDRFVMTTQDIRDILEDDEDLPDSASAASLHISEDSYAQRENPTQTTIVRQTQALPVGIYKQKLRYDSNQDISRFFNAVESYAFANGITSDDSFIAISNASLNQDLDGATAVELLTQDDYENWSKYKRKLITILDHNPDYYRNKFNSFQRGDSKLGLALSNLINYFRKGWQINRALTAIESEMVKIRFIESMRNPMKMMLHAEQKRLNLENILERALELESAFSTDSNQEPVNVVTQPKPENLIDIFAMMQQQHQEIVQLLSSNARSGFSAQNRNRNRDPSKFRILGGLCSFYVNGLDCPRRSCKFRHEGPVTQEQRDVFAQK